MINAQALAADEIRLTVRGGHGKDLLTGSAGNGLFSWAPGDGSDTIEGGMGDDMAQIAGADIAGNSAFSANGTQLPFSRDIGIVVLDINDVERVGFAAPGAANTPSFTNLSGTAVRRLMLDLGVATTPTGDGQADTITIATPPGAAVSTGVRAGTWTVFWSSVRISVNGVEPALARIILQISAGASQTVPAGTPEPTAGQ